MPSALSYIYEQQRLAQNGGGYMLMHNAYTSDEKLQIPYYQKENEYYFVDYLDQTQCRWVRTPSQTMEGVLNIMHFIEENNVEVKNFRVLPEKWLSELKESEYDQEKNCYKLDEITNRVHLFGNREEQFAEKFFGVEGLSRMKDESKQEWCARLTTLQKNDDERLKFVNLHF